MTAATKMKSLKGLTHAQILAETDHFFTEGEGDASITPHGSNTGPECFLLNEREFQLVLELERLEDEGASPKQQQAVLLQIRAVARSIQALGCASPIYPR